MRPKVSIAIMRCDWRRVRVAGQEPSSSPDRRGASCARRRETAGRAPWLAGRRGPLSSRRGATSAACVAHCSNACSIMTTDVGDERRQRGRRIIRTHPRLERGTLRIGQRLSAGVGKEPIEGAAGMAHVKADGRGAAGRRHTCSAGTGGQTIEILARLNERVHDGHQQRLEPGHRSALPRFGLYSGHATTVLPYYFFGAVTSLRMRRLASSATGLSKKKSSPMDGCVSLPTRSNSLLRLCESTTEAASAITTACCIS